MKRTMQFWSLKNKDMNNTLSISNHSEPLWGDIDKNNYEIIPALIEYDA